jgi:hypothetical protein
LRQAEEGLRGIILWRFWGMMKEKKLLDFWEDNKVWSRLDFGVLDRSKI